MGRVLLLASVITTNITPALGQIGAHYFDSLNQSQVWINIEPQNLAPGPNPVQLNATVAFSGRTLSTAPAAVDIRVQAHCLLVFPTRIRQAMLTLTYDGIEVRAGRDLPFRTSSACGDDFGSVDVVLTRIPFVQFGQIAAARDVEIRALGFHVRVTTSDLRALSSFQTAVASGVTVR